VPAAGEPGYEYVGGATGGSTVVPAGAATAPCWETEVVAAVDAAATTANADSSTGSPRRPAMIEGTRTWTIRGCGRTEKSRRTASRINCLRPGACVRQALPTLTRIAVAREGRIECTQYSGVERFGSPVPGGSAGWENRRVTSIDASQALFDQGGW
jgi:hypothetical protein